MTRPRSVPFLLACLSLLLPQACDSGEPGPAPDAGGRGGPPPTTSRGPLPDSMPDPAAIALAIERINNASAPHYHLPALNRIRAAGVRAAAPIVEFVKRHGQNALTLSGTMALAHVPDDRIRDLAVELVRRKDFFWRPAAMESLAALARPSDAAVFEEGLEDILWGVRRASVSGLVALARRDMVPQLRDLLGDEFYEVRAEAAKGLHAFGDESGLPVLVDALALDAFWFDIDYGQMAREDAWKFLKKVAGDDMGFKPWESEENRAKGLAAWIAWMEAKDPAWRDKVPEKVRARRSTAVYVFGWEIRSCQRGDFFLRIDEDWNLVLGTFDPEVVPLTVEERTRIDRLIGEAKAVSRDEWYGQTGCDVETWYLSESGGFARLRVGLGGRPNEVDDLVDALLDLVGARFGTARGQELRDKSNLFRLY